MPTEVTQVERSVKELLRQGLNSQAVDLLINSGHGKHVSIGALTTPIQGGGGGTTIDLAQPQGMIGIGGGQAIIPVRIKVECEVGLIAADSEVDEIIIAVDTENSPDGVNETTVVNEEIYNMRMDLGNSQVNEITAWSAITSALTTSPVESYTLDRAQNFRDFSGTPANALSTQFGLLYEPKHPPLIVAKNDGMTLLVYWGGTVAVSGYAQIDVVVFDGAWAKGIGQ